MAPPVATIGSVNLLGRVPVVWRQTTGILPHIAELEVAPSDVATLEGNPGPIELRIGDLVVSFLFVLGRRPGPSPKIARVAVADRRWLWSYGHALRRFNFRRHIGYRRLDGATGTPEIDPVVNRVLYAPWSTRNQQGGGAFADRWRGDQALRDVAERIETIEKRHVRDLPGFTIDPAVLSALQDFPIEDFSLDDSADRALERILAYLPEAEVTVDLSGEARIFSRSTGDEAVVLDQLGPEVVGEGHVEFISRRLVRPRYVDVLFTREIELRFDFNEGNSEYALGDLREATNVLPISDFTLDIGGTRYVSGTWFPIGPTLFRAWGFAPQFNRYLTQLDIQKAMVPFLGLWAGLDLLGVTQPDVDWSSRIASVQEHYRRTYRINPNWMERLFDIRAYRVATIDPVNGTRAPAVAYSDYAYLASMRSLWKQSRSNELPLNYASNVRGYPTGQGNPPAIDANAKPAPAIVSVLDSDQGVLQATYTVDPTRMFEQVLPSMVTTGEGGGGAGVYPLIAGPTGNIRDTTNPVTFDAISDLHGEAQIPRLTANHRIAFIVTVLPGAPNDERQLHRIRKEPKDVSSIVPGGLRNGLLDAAGPPLEIRIGGAIETARIAWSDVEDAKNRIEAAFGLGGNDAGEYVDLSDLCINQGTSEGGASLDAIAEGAAARAYAEWADHYQGDVAGKMNPAVRPRGIIVEVTHELDQRGRALTRTSFPDDLPKLNLFSVLDNQTRAVILKQATPAKGGQ